MDNEETHSPVLEETKRQMDIVPYTRRDRITTFVILLVVCANFLLLLWSLPWKWLF